MSLLHMEDHHFLQPLLPTTTTTTRADGTSLIYRVVFIIFIGIVSIYANLEASKGFAITIVNEAGDTPPGRRFDLFYVSNDGATRIVLRSSEFVERILYPDDGYLKKKVNRITLRLDARNLIQPVIVSSDKENEFVLHISPSILEANDFNRAVLSAVQNGVARVWLWDGHGNAPQILIDGMANYITRLAGFGEEFNSVAGDLPESGDVWWESAKHPIIVAQFLNYFENQKPGFIGRLNQALRVEWHDRTVGEALGRPAQHLCGSFNSSGNFH